MRTTRHAGRLSVALPALMLALGACAAKKLPEPKSSTTLFVRAEATPDPPRPMREIVRVATPPNIPGQLKPVPKSPTRSSNPAPAPPQVMPAANRQASQAADFGRHLQPLLT